MNDLNEKNLPLGKWLIDKTNTKDYRIEISQE